ncbi:DNA-methyltransferase [Mycoplasma seminis]|uniref:Methyltransferase n=1 Tax=Mycoplasma seminis TaxID=512749 RepID=A0ABY9H9S3_9MOLU|nr:site-specific DNA-methyltransferase [Mycoplasma seminis]WLP85322.1 DNA methyltransferase [Mycoplasma seminis]
MKTYFESNEIQLYLGDCNKVLKKIPEKSVDVIFADPPYFLSNENGISCHAGKQVSVYKADWDKSLSVEERLKFNRKWIKASRKVLKDDGTIWISGTYHNIYTIGVALELEGFSIINNITWQKPNPAPNLACRCFTHSTETILWARKINNGIKGKHYFDYQLMKQINDNKQMKDVWTLNLPAKDEKKFGKHPTQKPLGLLERIILASSKQGDVILDPFNGSGTTGVAAVKLNRKYIGIDIETKYLKLTIERIKDVKN